MGADRTIFLAHLSLAWTPQACSWREWKDWVHGPQYNPCLAREPLDDWQVELAFTGIWSGLSWEKPKFFKVVIIHPEHSGFWGEFETYEQARRAMRQALEECWRRAQKDLPVTGNG
jgi:hypothetical protein